MLKESDGSKPLACWDTPYFTSKLKRKYLQVSPTEFSPYFSLGACMEGLNILMQSLYGIKLENVETMPGNYFQLSLFACFITTYFSRF